MLVPVTVRVPTFPVDIFDVDRVAVPPRIVAELIFVVDCKLVVPEHVS